MDTMKVNQKQKEYYLEQGYWGHETLLDRFLRTVERFPDREYVVMTGETVIPTARWMCFPPGLLPI